MSRPRTYLGFLLACLVAIAVDHPASTAPAPKKLDPPKVKRKEGAIRVLVPRISSDQELVVARLKGLKFDVVVMDWKEVDPAKFREIDVVLLPTHWADGTEHTKHFEAKALLFHGFVEGGGGLLVCQPNADCRPKLLPYPITFQNGYASEKPERENLAPTHFITEDLADDAMPFPYDPMIEVDRRYTILAKQKSTGFPSLAVASYGDGRIVVQTGNENGGTIRFGDEILRRMIVWAAGRDGR